MADKKQVPTNDTPTEASVEQTKPTLASNLKRITKTELEVKDDKWVARLEFADENGNKTQETREFDDLSQATSWVAGTEVEMQGSEQEAADQEPTKT